MNNCYQNAWMRIILKNLHFNFTGALIKMYYLTHESGKDVLSYICD